VALRFLAVQPGHDARYGLGLGRFTNALPIEKVIERRPAMQALFFALLILSSLCCFLAAGSLAILFSGFSASFVDADH
jgi:hypothetical protein